MPASLKTDFEGFEFFAMLLTQTAKKAKFVFDFSQVSWIEANLCAILGGIIKLLVMLDYASEYGT